MRTVEDLVLTYYSSNDFSMLRDKSKKDYQYFLNMLVGEFGLSSMTSCRASKPNTHTRNG